MTRIVESLAAWMQALAPKAVTPQDMLERFGRQSPAGRQFIHWVYDLYKDNEDLPIIDDSFSVWRGLYKEGTNLDNEAREAVKRFAGTLGINLEKNDVEPFLFAIESYLALLMKLLLARVAVQRKIVTTSSLRSLFGHPPNEGYRALESKIPYLSGVFEEDIFDWFLEPARKSQSLSNEADRYLGATADALDNLDFSALDTDLVRELYHGFFDRQTRRALGEFYTNEKLVDEILDGVAYSAQTVTQDLKGEGILIDPACGSGTFLVRAIHRWEGVMNSVRNNPKAAANALRTITHNIIGIDIHPFAVAMARVNYLLAISPLLTPAIISEMGKLDIPVYWTDSLISEAVFHRVDKKAIKIRVPSLGTFQLPLPKDLDWTTLTSFIRRGLAGKWTVKRFLDEIPEEPRLIYKDILEYLYKWFYKRHFEEDRDGRWISVLRNASVVHGLRSQCSFVVGNPPWVRIQNIDRAIRDRLKDEFTYCSEKWCPKFQTTTIRFAGNFDYCIAFVESGLRYLKPGRKLGFVVTSKVMQTLYAGTFRRELMRNTRIRLLKDYSLSGIELFRDAINYPLIMILENSPPQTGDVVEVDLVGANGNLKWNESQASLSLDPRDDASAWMMAPPAVISVFRRIMKNTIRLGDRHQIRMGVMTQKDERFILVTIRPTADPNIVLATTQAGDMIRIEKDLVCPLVRGADVQQWVFGVKVHILWPLDKNGNALGKLPKEAESYFTRPDIKADLEKRSDLKANQQFWTIFRVYRGTMGHKAAWQELSQILEAAELPPTWNDRLLGKRPLIPLKTVFFVSPQGELASARLVCLLNSTPVRAFLVAFAERASGSYFRYMAWNMAYVPIPDAFPRGKTTENYDQQGADSYAAEIYGLAEEDMKILEEYLNWVLTTKAKSSVGTAEVAEVEEDN